MAQNGLFRLKTRNNQSIKWIRQYSQREYNYPKIVIFPEFYKHSPWHYWDGRWWNNWSFSR